jgi:hypothetical protein
MVRRRRAPYKLEARRAACRATRGRKVQIRGLSQRTTPIDSGKLAGDSVDRRLIEKGWLRSHAGLWSRWGDATGKWPGWAVYQASRALAVVIQDHLDHTWGLTRRIA